MQAEEGLRLLRANVDTLITIPNQRLLQVVERAPLYAMLSGSLITSYAGGPGHLRLITTPGLINLDFADVQTIMTAWLWPSWGPAWRMAITVPSRPPTRRFPVPCWKNPPLTGPRRPLNVTGGPDMALHEIHERRPLSESAHEEAHIIFGA